MRARSASEKFVHVAKEKRRRRVRCYCCFCFCGVSVCVYAGALPGVCERAARAKNFGRIARVRAACCFAAEESVVWTGACERGSASRKILEEGERMVAMLLSGAACCAVAVLTVILVSVNASA